MYTGQCTQVPFTKEIVRKLEQSVNVERVKSIIYTLYLLLIINSRRAETLISRYVLDPKISSKPYLLCQRTQAFLILFKIYIALALQ